MNKETNKNMDSCSSLIQILATSELSRMYLNITQKERYVTFMHAEELELKRECIINYNKINTDVKDMDTNTEDTKTNTDINLEKEIDIIEDTFDINENSYVYKCIIHRHHGDTVIPKYLRLKGYNISMGDKIELIIGGNIVLSIPFSFYKMLNKIENKNDDIIIDLCSELFNINIPLIKLAFHEVEVNVILGSKLETIHLYNMYNHLDSIGRRLLAINDKIKTDIFIQMQWANVKNGSNIISFEHLGNGLLIQGNKPINFVKILLNSHGPLYLHNRQDYDSLLLHMDSKDLPENCYYLSLNNLEKWDSNNFEGGLSFSSCNIDNFLLNIYADEGYEGIVYLRNANIIMYASGMCGLKYETGGYEKEVINTPIQT